MDKATVKILKQTQISLIANENWAQFHQRLSTAFANTDPKSTKRH